MTVHLYYNDATLTHFDATITARETIDGKLAVSLDQTAFYPTSGGQPYDTGTLEGIPVTDVWVDDSDTIWHQVDAFPEADAVHGEIDWQRRFDLMQQHTGQHILSAAFDELYKAATIGFHLSDHYTTIDLDMPKCSWKQAFEAESLANRIVFDNVPVTMRIISQDEKDTIAFRKAPVVEGNLRVIFAGDFDACACGGTHVAHTGEIGLIKIIGIERNKQGVRITFQCGARALKHYQETLQTAQTASKTLSVGVVELPQAISRLQDDMKSAQRAFRTANSALQSLNAERLWADTPEVDGRKAITLVWEEGTFADLRLVVNQLRERPRTVVMAGVFEGKGLRLVCGRSDDLPDVDARVLFKRAAEVLGVKGGGPPNMVQGGGPLHPKDDVEKALKTALAE